VLIDAKGKPWLLEVNHSPSFTTDAAVDKKIKGDLIRQTFDLLNVNPKAKA
jgi:tubulin polyglutamylase TTLL6/13